jgi:glycerol dehydrogenase
LYKRRNEVPPFSLRGFAGTGYAIRYEIFRGECPQPHIDRLVERAKAEKSTVVVGISGDKILDTAKDVAYYAGLPVDIIPTVASTDSPCSSLSVIYQDNGEFDRYLFWTAVRIWCWWTQM